MRDCVNSDCVIVCDVRILVLFLLSLSYELLCSSLSLSLVDRGIGCVQRATTTVMPRDHRATSAKDPSPAACELMGLTMKTRGCCLININGGLWACNEKERYSKRAA